MHVYGFCELPMEEGIRDIKLMNDPAIVDSDSVEYTKCSNLGHWTKCFSIVEAFLLLLALSDESGFITSDTVIQFVFDFKHPTRTKNGMICRGRF